MTNLVHKFQYMIQLCDGEVNVRLYGITLNEHFGEGKFYNFNDPLNIKVVKPYTTHISN